MPFETGKIKQSRKINDAVIKNDQFANDLAISFRRHLNGDWGEVSDDNHTANDAALFGINNILTSCYSTCMGNINITTDRRQSETYIMFENENRG